MRFWILNNLLNNYLHMKTKKNLCLLCPKNFCSFTKFPLILQYLKHLKKSAGLTLFWKYLYAFINCRTYSKSYITNLLFARYIYNKNAQFVACTYRKYEIDNTDNLICIREAAKKSFFSGPATKAFPPPPHSSLFFFRASKDGLFS